MVERVRDRDPAAAFVQRRDQFDLVVIVFRARRDGDFTAVGKEHVVRRLEKIERRFAVDLVAHFGRVGGVVAPDAEDAADGKDLIAVEDRQGRRRWRCKEVAHGSGVLHTAPVVFNAFRVGTAGLQARLKAMASSSRSSPQNSSSPTTNDGAPNTPAALAASVLAR